MKFVYYGLSKLGDNRNGCDVNRGSRDHQCSNSIGWYGSPWDSCIAGCLNREENHRRTVTERDEITKQIKCFLLAVMLPNSIREIF